MKLKGEICRVVELADGDMLSMFRLLSRHFERTNYQVFLQDLLEKEHAILLRDLSSGEIQGFSTMTLLETVVEGISITALFSGDTIVDRHHWGSPELAHAWGRFTLSLIDRTAGKLLYWFLICQGYRTYRFLPLYFREFYPQHDLPFPVFERKVLDALASYKFGKQFNPESGIIHLSGPQYCLKPGIAEITDNRLSDPHIRFFCEKNPYHAAGDELACIAPLTRENFTPAAYRVIFGVKAVR